MVGLGNPGREYQGTPHNAGFAVVDVLAEQFSVVLRRSLRFRAHTAGIRVGEIPVLLVKPDTFMNLSGRAVSAVLRWQKSAPDDLMVVADDADLPLGRLRVRAGGSSGGQRGLASIIEAIGTDAFTRVRIGIGRGSGDRDLVSHVLGRPSVEDRKRLGEAATLASEAVLTWLREGTDAAMNAFNGKVF